MKKSARKTARIVWVAGLLSFAVGATVNVARADEFSGHQAMRDANVLFQAGQYFKAARYAFSAKDTDPQLSAEANALISRALVRAGLYHSASYFFIKTLESGNRAAIRRVLGDTEALMVRTGADLLRNYLIRHTKLEDYDAQNRSAFLFSLAKQALLAGEEEKTLGFVSGMQPSSTLWAYGLQLRGSAHTILGRTGAAIEDFRKCVNAAESMKGAAGEDLAARCLAGEARTFYQLDRFDEADRAYDRIPKASLVWPDILFEQAWNAFARKEYNRTLGRLVSYKSPALSFVFNPEVDVLRAQAFLALCLYSEANEVINEFNGRYARVGEEVKDFVEANSSNLPAFFALGKEALLDSIYTRKQMNRLLNRFVRSPYFQELTGVEQGATREMTAVRRFDALQPGVVHDPKQGFPGFLMQVLKWRAHTARVLGGAFVKNSLMDHHAELLADFDKMSFIKLEMLKRAKEQLASQASSKTKGDAGGNRNWGNVEPVRRDYQYYWSFNGEFWNDELGDYVFGLESECRGGDGS